MGKVHTVPLTHTEIRVVRNPGAAEQISLDQELRGAGPLSEREERNPARGRSAKAMNVRCVAARPPGLLVHKVSLPQGSSWQSGTSVHRVASMSGLDLQSSQLKASSPSRWSGAPASGWPRSLHTPGFSGQEEQGAAEGRESS